MLTRIIKTIIERRKKKMILLNCRNQQIEAMAEEILEKNNLLYPRFDLIKYLKEQERFDIAFQNMPKGTTGFIFVNEDCNDSEEDSIRIIAVNSDLQEDPCFLQKSRFIIAHEYAHSILHKRDGLVLAHRSVSMKKTKKELEADLFARCLLMPKKLVNKLLENASFQQLKTESQINYISTVFNVTTKKAQERLKDLQYHA